MANINPVLFMPQTENVTDLKRALQDSWNKLATTVNNINQLYVQATMPTLPENTICLWQDTTLTPNHYYLVANFGTGTHEAIELTSTGQTDHGALGGLADDDHTQYVKHALATAANDFLVASGSGAFVKKTLAETRDILFQKARAYRNAAQAITGGGNSKVGIDTDSFDPANITDLNNNRITPTLAGYYQVNGQVLVSDLVNTDALKIMIYKTGNSVAVGNSLRNNYGSAVSIAAIVSDLIYMNGTTDYLELYVYTGSNCNLEIYNTANYLSAVGPF